MNESDSEPILNLIDKIIGYADGQPLILNHLVLLRSRTEALEDYVHTLETDTRYEKLASELDRTEMALSEAHQELEQLHSAAAYKKHAEEHTENRPPPEHDILVLLMSRNKLSEEEIATNFHISQQAARQHLTKLKTDKLINSILGPFNSRIPTQYHLADDGRAYLHRRGLLQ